ncbi:hypothetical protein F4780DRAFT_759772 [Xylariomycetidae sp. FL0641]|nr:hypothetical protein F4780DRAFT_759772 [Xylariomycetidae sp. FL0641]
MVKTPTWFQRAQARALKLGTRKQVPPTTANTSVAGGSGNDHEPDTAQVPSTTNDKTSTQILYKVPTVKGLPTLIPDTVSVYNLNWEELEPYLRKIYPNITFKKSVGDDYYLIYVPTSLTQADRDEIEELRKIHRARASATGGGRVRQEHSPDEPRRPAADEDDDDDD